MVLKVVLKRNTRKNNVNHRKNMYELAQFLQSLDEQPDNTNTVAAAPDQDRQFYFHKFAQISRQPQYLAYQQYYPQFLNEVLHECNGVKLPSLPLKEYLMRLKQVYQEA